MEAEDEMRSTGVATRGSVVEAEVFPPFVFGFPVNGITTVVAGVFPPPAFGSPARGITTVVAGVFPPPVYEFPLVDIGVIDAILISPSVLAIPVEGGEEDLFADCRLGLESFV